MNACQFFHDTVPIELSIEAIDLRNLFAEFLHIAFGQTTHDIETAQTAFLPIFFILISVAVTCINGGMDVEEFYYYIPVYGQFYGLGDAINGEPLDYYHSKNPE